jgi:hypothetical protein
MQRPDKRSHDSEEPHDTALIPRPTSSLSVARAEALSEALSGTAVTKRQKVDEDTVVGRGPGHTFDRSVACDNARVQYGDTYNVSYHRAAEPEPQDSGWPQAMAALRYPQMELRRQTVRDAHTGTCGWIFKKGEYTNWCDTEQIPLHHGFLWIKSKPGAGKSTLMKFLLESMEQQSSPAEAVISFFFNARGDQLEHSLEGMYRQLLHQLLTRVERLQSLISASEITVLSPLDWPPPLLENLFKKCVMGLGQVRVTCFIDALDECPESKIRDLVEFFENLGECAAAKSIGFRVCFSSRHYPNVTLEKCQHLMLDDQGGHQHDIAAYVKSKLRLSKSKTNDEIKADVQKRAQGVFLWVVLVVKRLNEDLDRGNVHHLQSRLKAIPDGLEALFRVRLTGDDDEMLRMMQWMMYARGTLTQKELYFGVHAGRLAHPEPWDRNEITSEVMNRFIVNCSRGMIESTKQVHPRTQFIHESVRDYPSGGGLELLAPQDSKNIVGASHDYLKRSCLRLLASSTFNHVPSLDRMLESDDEQAYVEAGRDLITQFPLLGYAFTHLLHHADIASRHGVDQFEFVTSFPFRIWNQVRVLMGRRPARSKTEVFAQYGCLELLKYETRPGYSLLAPAEHMLVIRTATRFLDHETLRVVIKRGEVARLSKEDQSSLIINIVLNNDLLSLQILFDSGMRLHTDESFRRALSRALSDRNAAIAQLLLDHESEVGPFTADALHNVVSRGSIDDVRALLDFGADCDARARVNPSMDDIDSSNRACLNLEIAEHLTVIEHAVLVGRADIVALLLEMQANQSTTTSQHYQFARPFYLAALLGRDASVSHLLEDKTWLARPDNTAWHDSLHAAAINGHTKTINILLTRDTNLQQTQKDTAYYKEFITTTAKRGHAQALRILLDEAPHFRFHGQGAFSDALVDAARHRNGECVKVLEERGAKPPEGGLPVLPRPRREVKRVG